jgi:sortase A
MSKVLTRFNLRHFNNLLSIVVTILALYIILVPYLPNIAWWIGHHTPFSDGSSVAVPAASNETKDSRPKEDTILIPSIDLNRRLYSGPTLKDLNFGPWLMPKVGSPDKGGNTVIAGHRFTYSGPDVFYHLDKIKSGDKITVYWHGQRYDWEVTQTKVVPATEVSVQQNTKDTRLTLITCTPLLTAKDRLIIIAKLTEHTP